MQNASCPHCGKVVTSNPQLAGRTVECPRCQGQFTMPGSSAPSPPPPPVIQQPAPAPSSTTPNPPLPPTLHSQAAPPASWSPALQSGTAPPLTNFSRSRPAISNKVLLLVVGIGVAVVLLAGGGVAVVVAIGWLASDSGGFVASGEIGTNGRKQSSRDGGNDLSDPSRPLPPVDQLIGRSFSANHPDAADRIAEAHRRGITTIQSGDKVHLGDVSVSNTPIDDYGGFVFGIGQDRDWQVTLTTAAGEEPLRIPRSFASDKTTVEKFLKQHHGATNVTIERLTEEPYYLAHLAIEGQPESRPIQHGRSRQEIQETLALANSTRVSIRKLERAGTVVRAVYRLQERTGAVRSDEEFLVLNGKVVYRYKSSRSAILFED